MTKCSALIEEREDYPQITPITQMGKGAKGKAQRAKGEG